MSTFDMNQNIIYFKICVWFYGFLNFGCIRHDKLLSIDQWYHICITVFEPQVVKFSQNVSKMVINYSRISNDSVI